MENEKSLLRMKFTRPSRANRRRTSVVITLALPRRFLVACDAPEGSLVGWLMTLVHGVAGWVIDCYITQLLTVDRCFMAKLFQALGCSKRHSHPQALKRELFSCHLSFPHGRLHRIWPLGLGVVLAMIAGLGIWMFGKVRMLEQVCWACRFAHLLVQIPFVLVGIQAAVLKRMIRVGLGKFSTLCLLISTDSCAVD